MTSHFHVPESEIHDALPTESELGSWDFDRPSSDSSSGDESSAWGEPYIEADEVAVSEFEYPCKKRRGDDSTDDDEEEASIEYDARLVAVSDAIKVVEPPGSLLYCGSRVAFPLPTIHVKGFGETALPFQDEAGARLVHVVTEGEEAATMVELKTSDSNPDAFTIVNAAWDDFIVEVVNEVRVPLGIHSTTVVVATLGKLQVCGPGNSALHSHHADSFATLVLVLPSRFSGGQWTVREPYMEKNESGPVEADRFDPGCMDPFALKYVAFYNTCAIETGPVTSGYYLCLVYNLVVNPTDEGEGDEGEEQHKQAVLPSPPVPDRNLSLYDALKTALSAYFCRDDRGFAHGEHKRQRTASTSEHAHERSAGFDITIPDTHRATILAYVLRHKYIGPALSPRRLQGKDVLVAKSLQQFCDDSGGAFQLFLAKAQFIEKWRSASTSEETDEDRVDDRPINRFVKLRSPWIEWGKAPTTASVFMTMPSVSRGYRCELATQAVPCGLFGEGWPFDFETTKPVPAEDGDQVAKLDNTAALVLIPVMERFRLQFLAEPDVIVKVWSALVDTNPRIARYAARAFTEDLPKHATFNSTELLHAATRLRSLEVYQLLIQAQFDRLVQPELRASLSIFDWQEVVAMMKKVVHVWHDECGDADRRCLLFTLAVLEGETDPTKITSVFEVLAPTVSALTIQRFESWFGRPYHDLMGRLLRVAFMGSAALVQRTVDTSDSLSFVVVVSPALRLMVKNLGSGLPVELRPVVKNMLQRMDDACTSYSNGVDAWKRSPLHAQSWPCDLCQVNATSGSASAMTKIGNSKAFCCPRSLLLHAHCGEHTCGHPVDTKPLIRDLAKVEIECLDALQTH